jgi:glycerophosphoryl diester phosphodiesterase
MPMACSNKHLNLPSVIAHRGLSSEAPENTIAAITLAAKRGFKWVEVDVKLSADNHLLLCHDEQLERTTNGQGKVSETNWSELTKLDAGSWFSPKFNSETLPELDLVLEKCQKLELGINLELKPLSNQINQFIKVLMPIILKYQNLGVCILVSSFNKVIIQELSNASDDIMLGYLVDDEDDLETIKTFINASNPNSIHLPEERCNKKFIDALKNYQKQLLVYTVNDKNRANELYQIGVDSVFSNFYLG